VRRLVPVLIFALAVAAAIPAVGLARTHYQVSVSIRYGADSFLRGKVKSPKGRCFKHAKVVVVKKNGDFVGKTFADGAGKWKLSAPGLTDLVYATVGRTGTSLESGVSFVCDKATSPTISPVDV
jgi:hypothetical protein